MTTTYDVVKPYLDGLQHIEHFCHTIAQDCHEADTALSQQEDSLMGYQVTFSGLGAAAFTNSVARNLARSQQLLTKLGDLEEASNHGKRMIAAISSEYEGYLESREPQAFVNGVFEDALIKYDTDIWTVQHKIKNETLLGVSVETVLDPRSDTWQYWVDYVKEEVLTDLQKTHNRYISHLENLNIDPKDLDATANQQQEINDEDNAYGQAKREVEQIAAYVLTMLQG